LFRNLDRIQAGLTKREKALDRAMQEVNWARKSEQTAACVSEYGHAITI